MVFIMAYLSYITADLVGWSGIVSLIGELPAPINCLVVELPASIISFIGESPTPIILIGESLASINSLICRPGRSPLPTDWCANYNAGSFGGEGLLRGGGFRKGPAKVRSDSQYMKDLLKSDLTHNT